MALVVNGTVSFGLPLLVRFGLLLPGPQADAAVGERARPACAGLGASAAVPAASASCWDPNMNTRKRGSKLMSGGTNKPTNMALYVYMCMYIVCVSIFIYL